MRQTKLIKNYILNAPYRQIKVNKLYNNLPLSQYNLENKTYLRFILPGITRTDTAYCILGQRVFPQLLLDHIKNTCRYIIYVYYNTFIIYI